MKKACVSPQVTLLLICTCSWYRWVSIFLTFQMLSSDKHDVHETHMCHRRHRQPFEKDTPFFGTLRSPTKVQWNSQKLRRDPQILKYKLKKKRWVCTQGLCLYYHTQEKLLEKGSAHEKRAKSAGTHAPCRNKSTSIMSSQCWNDGWMIAESKNTFKQNVQPFVSACVQDCMGDWLMLCQIPSGSVHAAWSDESSHL